jgi:hypothetical protein
MLGRDGVTVFNDYNAFGMEWQVRDEEPMLFHNVEGPQYPAVCSMADVSSSTRRRLGESAALRKKAEVACANVSNSDMDDCAADVVATEDSEMAASYL